MKKEFDELGTFAACHAAEDWCEERGISVGIMERYQPRGLVIGDCYINKWSNLSSVEKHRLDGRMTGDMMRGPVFVELPGNEEDY